MDAMTAALFNQLLAALSTLRASIYGCPEGDWDAVVDGSRYCQIAFHALFWADYYLDAREGDFRASTFHLANADMFRDYEELEDRAPQHMYPRPWLRTYLEEIRAKVGRALEAEIPESLAAPCGFEWRKFSRTELHIYNTRHLQHHAAQLSLWLQRERGQKGAPWMSSGWKAG